MPPKTKVTKESILAAALQLVRESGAAALNARAVAKRLDCSTQPIFSNYASMEELREDVLKAADERYQQYLADGRKDPSYPPYKASGMAYIRFAKEERELFKLLFMRDRSGEIIEEDREGLADLFHLEMWIYVHGIATMVATAYLDWDWEMISRLMTDAYEGIKGRFTAAPARR